MTATLRDIATFGRTKQNKASASDDWETEWELVHGIAAEYGPIILDVAADAKNAKAGRYFTKEQDALQQDWVGDLKVEGIDFCNPPYSRPNKPAFSKKAIETARAGRGTAVVLPAGTGNAWFHDLFLRPFHVTGEAHPDDGPLRGWWLSGTNGRIRQVIHFLSYRAVFASPLNPAGNTSTGGTVVIACLPPGTK